MTQVLVTGGAGFIGSSVVRALLSAGHRVIVLDNLSSGYRANLSADAEFVQGDVRDADLVLRLAKGCATIFHLAASVGNKRSIDDPRVDAEVNVLGTLAVLEAARRHNVGRIVYSSSAGIYGALKTIPIAEEHPQDPDSPYGVSKLAAEKACLVYNKLYDMRNVCLRYFNVYGERQRFDAYGNVIPIFAERMLRRQPITIFGDGDQTRDFVNVVDVARANLAAANTPTACGVFNLGSGTRITINELAMKMQTTLGLEVSVEHAPPRAGDVRDSLADIRRARQAFGFEPTVEINAGLAAYLAWLASDPITRDRWAAERERPE